MDSAASEGGHDLDCDVAIVGYGPVGCVLAILLGQLGRRVIVLDRWSQPYPLPRAVHFDHEVGRILQACGIGDELEVISEPADIYEWRNGAGTTLLRFGRRGLGSSGWPQSSMFNQPTLEARLDARAHKLSGIEVRRGFEVTAVAHDARSVTVGGKGHDGETVTVRSRYAVGCDGANSTVRKLLNVEVHDLGFFYDWLIVDVRLNENRTFDPLNLQICDPARPTTAVSGGPGRRRWEFMRLPHESIEALDHEATAWRLLADCDVTPTNATLERHAVYRFQARWVEQWRAGRILLAGDAAHQMPPFAGQGMCAGVRDAANLAWKLDLTLDGRAADALLDTYQTERAPNVRAVIELSMALGRVICVSDPTEAAERDAAMSAGVVDGEVAAVADLPGIESGLRHRTDSHAGALFPQGFLATADGRRRLDDISGHGWRLFAAVDHIDEVALEPGLADWFADIDGLVVLMRAADADGTLLDWFDARNRSVALVRPDFHVYGTAFSTDGANELVRQLQADLRSP